MSEEKVDTFQDTSDEPGLSSRASNYSSEAVSSSCFSAFLSSHIRPTLSKQKLTLSVPPPFHMPFVPTIIAIYGKLIMPIAGFHTNSFSFLKARQDVLYSNLHLAYF